MAAQDHMYNVEPTSTAQDSSKLLFDSHISYGSKSFMNSFIIC